MRSATLGLCAALAVLSRSAHAQEIDAEGYLDFRLVSAAAPPSYLTGGVGTLRYGHADGASPTGLHFGDLSVAASAMVTEDVLVYANARYDVEQRTAVDLLEGYARYRPVSLSRWRWSIKAGAFFPPISEENTGIGWTSPWTLTPSAINSWVGEELRTIGGESTAAWRGDRDTITLIAALYGWNDPAGSLLANGGWSLSDRTIGLFDLTRLPNATEYDAAAIRLHPFREIDERPGWYGAVRWQRAGVGSLQLLRYDNLADSAVRRDGQIAWHTSFWSLGGETAWDNLILLSQAMAGETEIDPSSLGHTVTRFQSAYLLAAHEWNDWRLAARIEAFGTQALASGRDAHDGEHGRALTLALTWLPIDHVRLTAEGIIVDSWRLARQVVDVPPRAVETQFQFAVRFYF